MTDETKKPGVDEEIAAKAFEAEMSEEAPMEEAEIDPAAPTPLDMMIAERDEMKDKYLRLAAEMDNLRRRTARDVRDAKSYSVANFARDMLAVSDNLRRALDAVPTDAGEADNAGLKALVEGVEMTERSMLSALERHGVKKLTPSGQKFNPNFHQAMFEVPILKYPTIRWLKWFKTDMLLVSVCCVRLWWALQKAAQNNQLKQLMLRLMQRSNGVPAPAVSGTRQW